MDTFGISILISLALLLAAVWVSVRSRWAATVGLVAVAIAWMTYDIWYPSFPIEAGIAMATIVTLLFVVGMLVRIGSNIWHIAAVVVACLGKWVIWVVLTTWNALVDSTVPLPIVILIVALAVFLTAAVIRRVRRAMA